MLKRFLAAIIVTVALLLSQGGNFLVAALCPHLESATASCNTPAEPKMAHEHMGHTGMGETEHENTAQPNPNAVAVSESSIPCLHCASHSGATSTSASLKETDGTRRSDQITNPHTVSLATVASSIVTQPTFRAHGPPGKTTPRHVLIHVFRI